MTRWNSCPAPPAAADHAALTPGAPLYRAVLAGLTFHGTSLRQTCKSLGIGPTCGKE